MKNIIYIWGDTKRYHDWYGKQADLRIANYQKKIQNDSSSVKGIKYLDIAKLDADNLAIDLIIAEDEIDTIVDLVKSAVKCPVVNTIVICDDLQILIKLGEIIKSPPKILSLDFLFNGLRNPAHKEALTNTLDTYTVIKNRFWPNTPVLGITNYLDAPQAVELKATLRMHGDDLYDKAAVYEALPHILENRIEYCKLLNLKKGTTEKIKIPDLIKSLNLELIEKEIVLKAEIKATKIAKLMDLQEKVLKFIFENEIKYKSTSLAGAILYCEKKPDISLTKIIFTHLNTTAKEGYKKYGLPEQPLASVQKYFKAFDENGIITKEAIIIIQLLKQYPKRWPISLEKALQKNPVSFTFVTFLDNIVVLL